MKTWLRKKGEPIRVVPEGISRFTQNMIRATIVLQMQFYIDLTRRHVRHINRLCIRNTHKIWCNCWASHLYTNTNHYYLFNISISILPHYIISLSLSLTLLSLYLSLSLFFAIYLSFIQLLLSLNVSLPMK
jgi:hypothetical protein